MTSPAVLLKNALGFTLVAANIPATAGWTWISLIVFTLGILVLAAWVFLRAQGVETWEATGRQRWTITLAIIALAAFPLIFADVNYDKAAPRPTNAPAVRGVFSRTGPNLTLVRHGGAVPFRCCSPILNREEWPYGTDQPTQRDLLLLLPVDTTQHIADLQLKIAGENGLEITADADALAQAGEHLEMRTYPNDTGPAAADGRHIPDGWVARIPITLNPTNPWDIGGNRYPLAVTATYNIEGDVQPRMFTSRAAIDAGVTSALYQMALAASILPLLSIGAAFTRWRRTR
jgi:hypothetical protein